MDDVADQFQDKVKELSDLELAVLTCLIAGEHVIVATPNELLDDVEHELRIIAAETFGLTSQVIDCSQRTTLDDIGDGVLLHRRANNSHIDSSESKEDKPREPGVITGLVGSGRPEILSADARADKDEVAEVIIAKSLNRTDHQVQIQALELIRSRRIFSRTGYHTAPKKFLFIALLEASGTQNLIGHLNDHFFISHYHALDDGFPNLEDHDAFLTQDDKSSTLSRARYSYMTNTAYSLEKYRAESLFSSDEIDVLSQHSESVKLGAEVRTYLHNIIVFTRLHRAVAGGVSSQATRHFHQLVRTLAPLHGIDFVTPSLVALAARKIYAHRIVLVRMENERSLQWGSSLEAVKEALQAVGVEDVLDDVLAEVDVPL